MVVFIAVIGVVAIVGLMSAIILMKRRPVHH
jgi:hypothetical protein